MADPRYTPENFIVNVAEGENDPVYEAITSDLFKVRFKVNVETQSMRPLFEQLEREDTLALSNYLLQMPQINRDEVIKMIMRAFRVPDMDKFIKSSVDAPEVRAAQLETQHMAGRMQDPGVLPAQDPATHLRNHQQARSCGDTVLATGNATKPTGYTAVPSNDTTAYATAPTVYTRGSARSRTQTR